MRASYGNWFGSVDHRAALYDLSDREVNYRPEEVDEVSWHRDEHRTRLPDEPPGDPRPGGSWELTRRLIEMYEPPMPSIIRGLYRADVPLLGRDMLLEGRFYGLHFSMGVRVTEVVDEVRDDGTRVWGWSYQTLQGHLERGCMAYEVVKHLDSGGVEFLTHGVSQRAPTTGPVISLGWHLFGRRTQLRFYRGCGARVQRIMEGVLAGRLELPTPVVVDGLVHAPSDARTRSRDRLAVRSEHPG
ncbi:MAG TPA: DUF1990 family protein [Segeticoccus sp.]|uniref:DUF1990 family protein n=1 Tax=Segeticoccus sp. TaxID=2706531 RepID=UPI002D7E85E2|nr:DUF1990 family protein [Segeticoccus sp.]HET8601641.1 DUF1990 family protein [Segeticoccus sp.]